MLSDSWHDAWCCDLRGGLSMSPTPESRWWDCPLQFGESLVKCWQELPPPRRLLLQSVPYLRLYCLRRAAGTSSHGENLWLAGWFTERVFLFSIKITNSTKKRERKVTDSARFGLYRRNWQVKGRMGKYLLRAREDLLSWDPSQFLVRLSVPWWSDYENNILSEPGASRGISPAILGLKQKQIWCVWSDPTEGYLIPELSFILLIHFITLHFVHAFHCQKTGKRHREILWLKGICVEMFRKSYDFFLSFQNNK